MIFGHGVERVEERSSGVNVRAIEGHGRGGKDRLLDFYLFWGRRKGEVVL